MEATPQQVAILQHTLGLRIDRREPYRNYFVADAGHHDMPHLQALEASGLMCRGRTPKFCNQSDIVFLTTDAGRALAIEQLPPEPKRTRYEDFRHADGAETFGEYLCGYRLPQMESTSEYRQVNGRYRSLYQHRMFRTAPGSYWHREVQGEWASTKKAAKASYKEALARFRSQINSCLRTHPVR